MKMRYPSSRCFVRAWGNSTDALLETPITHVDIHGSYVQSKSRVVCVASKCIPGFVYFTSEDKCFGLTKIVSNGKSKSNARQACKNLESTSTFMEASGSGTYFEFKKVVIVFIVAIKLLRQLLLSF